MISTSNTTTNLMITHTFTPDLSNTPRMCLVKCKSLSNMQRKFAANVKNVTMRNYSYGDYLGMTGWRNLLQPPIIVK